MAYDTHTLEPGARIYVRRPVVDTRRVEAVVQHVRDDGTVVATIYRRQAVGKSWIPTTSYVRPQHVLGRVDGR